MNYKKITIAFLTGTIMLTAENSCCSVNTGIDLTKKQETKSNKEIVLATVNGDKITQKEVDKVVQSQIQQMLQYGQNIPKDQLDQMTNEMTKQAVDMLVDMKILDQAIAKSGLDISKDELKKYIKNQIDDMLKGSPMSFKDYEKMLKERSGMTFEEMLEQETSRPEAKRTVLQSLYIEKENPKAIEVTEKETNDFYTKNKDRFSTPEEVQASHILIKIEKDATDKDKAAAKKKIEAIKKQIDGGADFAKLAKENSACPSSSQGGDLGFFGRGQMVPAFEKATFAMKVGDVSDVVETQFGYHLIKKTGEKPAKVTPLKEVASGIKAQLKMQKTFEAQQAIIDKLKKSAKIKITLPESSKKTETPDKTKGAKNTKK
jgi:peptidyl-prolyl cis-trans isomerase C